MMILLSYLKTSSTIKLVIFISGILGTSLSMPSRSKERLICEIKGWEFPFNGMKYRRSVAWCQLRLDFHILYGFIKHHQTHDFFPENQILFAIQIY
jgi:hypothetical protein